MGKVGRPRTDKPYRQNIVRVGTLEDILERILEEIPNRSVARTIVEQELSQLRLKETQKLLQRISSK